MQHGDSHYEYYNLLVKGRLYGREIRGDVIVVSCTYTLVHVPMLYELQRSDEGTSAHSWR